jgi:hypothetical protein
MFKFMLSIWFRIDSITVLARFDPPLRRGRVTIASGAGRRRREFPFEYSVDGGG